ncbi:MAG: GNAT family N-acetyltransferase [Bacteroidota bacterium]
MPVLTATIKDIPSLIALINNAYRGDASRQGWTTEANLLEGELRTDEKDLLQLMETPGATFLKYENEDGIIEGTVLLKMVDKRIYLGMLSVSPLLQAKGIGKELMAKAEVYAKENGCHSIFMRVISVRDELIAWYERKGYRKTGEIEAFPPGNHFGTPTQPLEFLIMEKAIS